MNVISAMKRLMSDGSSCSSMMKKEEILMSLLVMRCLMSLGPWSGNKAKEKYEL